MSVHPSVCLSVVRQRWVSLSIAYIYLYIYAKTTAQMVNRSTPLFCYMYIDSRSTYLLWLYGPVFGVFLNDFFLKLGIRVDIQELATVNIGVRIVKFL